MQPLNLNLSGVDTSMPRILPGKYTVAIEGVPTVEESKSNPGTYNLKVTYKTVDDVPTDDGKTLKAGALPLIRYYQIPGMCKPDNEEMAKKSLALFQLAVMNLKNTEENVKTLPDFTNEFLAQLPGVRVTASIKTEKEQEGSEYGPRSVIGGVFALDS